MASSSGVTGSASPSLELRPKRSRQPVLVLLLPVIVGLGAIGIAEHQILGFVFSIVVIVSGFLGSLLKVRITVTPDEIVVADTFGAGRHDRAPRSSVASIHIFSYWVVLTGLDGRSVLRSRPYWTVGQLLDLSDDLGVPLISHYRLGGFLRRNAPTVVTRTAVPERSYDQDSRVPGQDA